MQIREEDGSIIAYLNPNEFIQYDISIEDVIHIKDNKKVMDIVNKQIIPDILKEFYQTENPGDSAYEVAIGVNNQHALLIKLTPVSMDLDELHKNSLSDFLRSLLENMEGIESENNDSTPVITSDSERVVTTNSLYEMRKYIDIVEKSKPIESVLYKLDDKFHLLISLQKDNINTFDMLMSEFYDEFSSDQSSIYRIKEHGEVIITNSAVDKLLKI